MSRYNREVQAERAAATQLYQSLASGQPPPTIYAPDLAPLGPVHLDVPFHYARYFQANVRYQPAGAFIVGPPNVVAGAVIGTVILTAWDGPTRTA